MADLQLLPQNWFSWNFSVTQGGASVAQILYSSSWKEKGTLNISGETYQVFREHFMAGRYLLEQNGQQIAQAQKPSALRYSFDLEFLGHKYTLKKQSVICRAFVLMGEDRQLGLIEPQGLLTRKAAISLPDTIPVPIQIFVIWLVLVSWKRESDAGSAGA